MWKWLYFTKLAFRNIFWNEVLQRSNNAHKLMLFIMLTPRCKVSRMRECAKIAKKCLPEQ